MRKAGVQESVIMEITGHSTREIFGRYNSVDTEDKKEAVKRLEVFLSNANQNAYQEAIFKKIGFCNSPTSLKKDGRGEEI